MKIIIVVMSLTFAQKGTGLARNKRYGINTYSEVVYADDNLEPSSFQESFETLNGELSIPGRLYERTKLHTSAFEQPPIVGKIFSLPMPGALSVLMKNYKHHHYGNQFTPQSFNSFIPNYGDYVPNWQSFLTQASHSIGDIQRPFQENPWHWRDGETSWYFSNDRRRKPWRPDNRPVFPFGIHHRPGQFEEAGRPSLNVELATPPGTFPDTTVYNEVATTESTTQGQTTSSTNEEVDIDIRNGFH